MKILMINKFLYPNGGSETYIFKLGEYLRSQGHEVQYFGMEHEGRCVGNHVNAYTSNMDFHGGSKLKKLVYPIKTIYSTEARKKIRLVLDDFQPDVCHLNNFNYQLTPSIILEIVKWQRQSGHSCQIVATAHDYQMVCPNHMLNIPATHENCEKCLNGNYRNCLRNKCIHGSRMRSAVGMLEAYFWKAKGVYKYIDTIVCCSRFMKAKLDSSPALKNKTVVLHNFVDQKKWEAPNNGSMSEKGYVLYFGRFSQEKGVATLLRVCRTLPEIPFVFAGNGPLEKEISGLANVKNVGFQNGDALECLIGEARFSVYPSEWYENGPFSVMESQMYGTPVLGANIGGIPELIQDHKTGELFESGNEVELRAKIYKLWTDKELIALYHSNCGEISFDTLAVYCEKLIDIYAGKVKVEKNG
ncbi:MAG: glycosyltransferase [Lachnospiraceae bacterium]|nr:glycosyltransferase [Lachnospiraceae bacterium]